MRQPNITNKAMIKKEIIRFKRGREKESIKENQTNQQETNTSELKILNFEIISQMERGGIELVVCVHWFGSM